MFKSFHVVAFSLCCLPVMERTSPPKVPSSVRILLLPQSLLPWLFIIPSCTPLTSLGAYWPFVIQKKLCIGDEKWLTNMLKVCVPCWKPFFSCVHWIKLFWAALLAKPTPDLAYLYWGWRIVFRESNGAILPVEVVFWWEEVVITEGYLS